MSTERRMPNGPAPTGSVGQTTASREATKSPYSRSRQKSTERKIFAIDGRRSFVAGTLCGETFRKRVKRQHLLRQPPAIAIQADVLNGLPGRGCRFVEAVLDDGRTLRAPLNLFFERGIAIDRGFGRQIALPLQLWQDAGAEQLALLRFEEECR